MSRMRWVCLLMGSLLAAASQANYLTATVGTMQVHLPTNSGYVHLTGLPEFDGGGCTSPWAIGNLDDDKFMIYIWPALMSAKNHGKSVTINVSGCLNGYPRIDWIQVNPS